MVRLHASDPSGHLEGSHLHRKARTANAVRGEGKLSYDPVLLTTNIKTYWTTKY